MLPRGFIYHQMKKEEIYQRLGRAVLLPAKKGTKIVSKRSWQKVTYATTMKPAYQNELARGNIAVLLGEPSNNLVSIDFDDEQSLAHFLSNNPQMETTLRTKGKKGGNIWLRMKGEYPEKCVHFKYGNNGGGEWRGGGCYTLISGKHPEGMEYRITNDQPVLEISFSDLNWKKFKGMSEPCPIDTIDTIDYTDTTDYTEERREKKGKTTFSQKVIKATKAREQLKSNLLLDQYYKLYIETKFTPSQGERNSQLVAMVTFLFRAVSEQITISLVNYFYDINQDIFIDTRSQHEKEALSHIRATRETWLDSLSKKERQLYDEASQASKHHETAFRVCRELADKDSNFYLSYKQLGDRIGIDSTQAGRILKQFIPLGILTMITKGTQHSKKGAGKATSYRWLL